MSNKINVALIGTLFLLVLVTHGGQTDQVEQPARQTSNEKQISEATAAAPDLHRKPDLDSRLSQPEETIEVEPSEFAMSDQELEDGFDYGDEHMQTRPVHPNH